MKLHALAQTHHTDGILLTGVEEDGLHELDAWLGQAYARWDAAYGAEENWRKPFAFPEDESTGGRTRLTGQAWLYTVEWTAAPSEGWDQFAHQRYDHGDYWKFTWGLMGYRPPSEGSLLSVFELHVEANLSSQRDHFLYGDLLPLLIDFLMVSQFIWLRYINFTFPLLRRQENALLEHVKRAGEEPLSPSLRATEAIVRHLTASLYQFSSRLGELIEDVHTVKTDCAAAKSIVQANSKPASEPPTGHFILST
jgi:hypothetical protein